MKKSDPKGWIRGNTKIGPVLEVTTSYLQGKNEVEIRVALVNKDNSHSWVRISHGLNKLVTDLAVFAQMCVASCVAWRPRSEPQRVTRQPRWLRSPPAQGGILILGTLAPRLPRPLIDHCLVTNWNDMEKILHHTLQRTQGCA